jgi:putative membrane protein
VLGQICHWSWSGLQGERRSTHAIGRAFETESGESAVISSATPVDDPRVYLAAERTFLAWVRTSVSLMGFGFVIARFALWTREFGISGAAGFPGGQMVSTWLGFVMVVVGVLVSVLAAARHRAYVGALGRGIANPPLHIKTSLVVAGSLALVGLALAIHILML